MYKNNYSPGPPRLDFRPVVLFAIYKWLTQFLWKLCLFLMTRFLFRVTITCEKCTKLCYAWIDCNNWLDNSKQAFARYFFKKCKSQKNMLVQIIQNECKWQSYWVTCTLVKLWTGNWYRKKMVYLCCATSKYVGVIYKINHYMNNQALRMLYNSLVYSRKQHGIIVWEWAVSCHLQPISLVSNRTKWCFNASRIAALNLTSIYKKQKIQHLKDI